MFSERDRKYLNIRYLNASLRAIQISREKGVTPSEAGEEVWAEYIFGKRDKWPLTPVADALYPYRTEKNN